MFLFDAYTGDVKMKTKVNKACVNQLVMILTGFLFTGAVGAQDQLDTTGLADPEVRAASCAEVAWDRQMLLAYPRIAEACQEVLTVDGEKWARFEADFVRQKNDGSVLLDFKDRQGGTMGNLTLMPAAGQRVMINDVPYRFSELRSNQTLNLYVPEGVFAVAVVPGAPREQLAQVVVEPMQVAETQTDRRLPDTAGLLPILAVTGLLSLLAGMGLAVRRILGTRNKGVSP